MTTQGSSKMEKGNLISNDKWQKFLKNLFEYATKTLSDLLKLVTYFGAKIQAASLLGK